MKQNSWLGLAFNLRASILPATLPRIFLCGAVAVVALGLRGFAVLPDWPAGLEVAPSVVLSLLLVFRTNTSYDRFWEGRKQWGNIVNATRNLSRRVWVEVEEHTPQDRQAKVRVLQMTVAFAVATKLHLRHRPVDHELASLVPPSQYQVLVHHPHPPLALAFWIGEYLHAQYERGCLSVYQMNDLNQLLDNLVAYLGSCERIAKTPIPLVYAIHIKQLLLVYCLTLPFEIVGRLGPWTIVVTILVSFTLLGVEEIGVEIENPFDGDVNDLPLDILCNTLRQNLAALISLNPTASQKFTLPETPADRL